MHEKIAKIPALREVVMLGYGSMIAKHCVAVPTCSAELLRVNTLSLTFLPVIYLFIFV